VDFTIFYDLIFEINTQDDWIVEGPHVLRAIKDIFRTNVRPALNENVIQWRIARRPFSSCRFLVEETCRSVAGITSAARHCSPATRQKVKHATLS